MLSSWMASSSPCSLCLCSAFLLSFFDIFHTIQHFHISCTEFLVVRRHFAFFKINNGWSDFFFSKTDVLLNFPFIFRANAAIPDWLAQLFKRQSCCFNYLGKSKETKMMRKVLENCSIVFQMASSYSPERVFAVSRLLGGIIHEEVDENT